MSSSDLDMYAELADNRQLFLTGELTSEVGNNLISSLLWLDAQSDEEITFHINSEGGDLHALLALYDVFQTLDSPIKTVGFGICYSSAAVLLLSGEKGSRYCYPHANIMLHSVQIQDLYGSSSDVEIESKRIKKLNDSLMAIIAQHCNQSVRKVKRNLSEDFFLTPKEAKAYGLIDGIIEYKKQIPVSIK